MLYLVQRGDSLSQIAARFGTTIESIKNANVICNPKLIFIGQPLIIPEKGKDLPRAGAGPYYIVQPGDSLYCISQQIGVPLTTLTEINGLENPNLIYPGQELLVINPTTDDPEQLMLEWERSPDENCMVYGFTEHGVYYIGSFEWTAFRGDSITFLTELLKNRCDIVRRYSAISFGRLALNGSVRKELIASLEDSFISDVVKYAIRRVDLGAMGLQRVHVMISNNRILNESNLNSPGRFVPAGTEIVVLRYFIPSPMAEEGPRGGLQIYDYVQVVGTTVVGFLPRLGYTEITFI